MFDFVLRQSLCEHKIVSIIYQNGNKMTQRNIRVTKIQNDKIEAYCYLRHKVRHFKKENILDAEYVH